MITALRLALLPYVDRVLWSSPRKRALRMARFARVERSSATDLRLAARNCSSAERAALYLRHAHDEARHCRAFHAQAERLARTSRSPAPLFPSGECEALFERMGELDFLAFVHVAERRGRRQFEIHVRTLARLDPELSALLQNVIVDELRHEQYSERLLVELAGSAQRARQRMRFIARWEAARAFRRLTRRNARALYALCAGVLYAACLPLRWLLPARRPSGLLPPAEP